MARIRGPFSRAQEQVQWFGPSAGDLDFGAAMRRSVSLVLIFTATASVAAAQEPILSLPQLRQCEATARPLLPERWQGVFLMAPFSNTQLVLTEIVHDDALQATRMKAYGLRSGSLDLFVHGDKTYALHSDGQ